MANSNHQSVTTKLTDLGLTGHEATVYLVILTKGEASGGEILSETKLHREQVYRALKQLSDLGLLTSYTKRKRSYYTATDPKTLVQQTKTKLEIAESIQPYLRALHRQQPHVIQVWEGADALERHFEDVLQTVKRNGEYLVLLGPGREFYALAASLFRTYGKKYAKRGIKARIVAYEGDDFSGQLASGQPTEVRYLPRSYAAPVGTVIFRDKVALEIVDQKNPSVITIENARLAEGYRQMFETLWTLSR